MNEKLAQEQHQLLVQSDDCVSIPQGETPALLLENLFPHHAVVKAVNFLRCGVPAVQVVKFTEKGADQNKKASESLRVFQERLTNMQLPGEEFNSSTKKFEDRGSKDVDSISLFAIITITRST